VAKVLFMSDDMPENLLLANLEQIKKESVFRHLLPLRLSTEICVKSLLLVIAK
jgi:hypothetical protein